MLVDEFIELYRSDPRQAEEIIIRHLRFGRVIDTRPECMILSRNYSLDLTPLYDIIEAENQSGSLPAPLKAFFGNNTKHYIKRKEPSIVIYDER